MFWTFIKQTANFLCRIVNCASYLYKCSQSYIGKQLNLYSAINIGKIDFKKNKKLTMKQLYFILAAIFLISCQPPSDELMVLFKLPKDLKEVSGITYNKEDNSIFAIQDRGNGAEILQLNLNGDWLKSIEITNAKNVDWEDITQDHAGNIYIGDFGNNENKRQDLSIYKISKEQLSKKNAVAEYKIEFSYPEQTNFPPKKKDLIYDVESFFELNGSFFLFTKNRSKFFDGTSMLYKVENKPGHQKAELLGSFVSCGNYNRCAVTSAAISPDATKIVVLFHDKIILFEDWKGEQILEAKKTIIELGHTSQKEAVTFLDNETILIADERKSKEGGNVYQLKIKI